MQRQERAGERPLADQELVEDDPCRIQVGTAIGLFATELFGRHVAGRAEHRAGHGFVRGVDLGDAEVAQLDRARLGDKDVVGLDVAVHDAAPMRMAQRLQQLTHQPHRLLGAESVFGVEQVLQCLAARHQFHHDVGQIGLVVVVVNLDDVGVLELGGRLRLGQKAPGIFLGIAGVDVVLADDLDGHEFAPQQAVPTFIDDTHRALAQRADDLILAKSFRVFGVHNQQDTASAAHKPPSRPPRLRGAGRRISQVRD